MAHRRKSNKFSFQELSLLIASLDERIDYRIDFPDSNPSRRIFQEIEIEHLEALRARLTTMRDKFND